jgi:serine/threonine protein phosphatase 1
MIQHFAINHTGTDVVVGDIHGCFDQLQAGLEKMGFDPTQDRCFSVGDLVDRGPSSPQALEWLACPWFHACRGNHEDMLLSATTDPDTLYWWVEVNGGDWWLSTDRETRERFVHRLADLPLVMEVETPRGLVGIVHADVPEALTWQEFLSALEAGEPDTVQTALWGRRRASGLVRRPVEGVDRVVCGHTIMPDFCPHAIDNVRFIDTGAFLQRPPARLTIVPLAGLFES